MQSFLDRHAGKIVSTLSCFDRLIFKGFLPLTWAEAFERFVDYKGILRKNFDAFAKQQSVRLKAHAQEMARRSGRPFQHFSGYTRDKDDRARQIARQDHVTSGLICVFSTQETCRSFALRYGEGKPRLLPADRRGLVLYYYFLDREFGFMHVRLETWFPMTIQIYINGHEWLAKKLDRHGLGYRKVENAFLALDDPARAQRFADAMARKNWPRILAAFARRVNPLLADTLRPMSYYFVTDQAEYATDLLFRDRASLEDFYPRLLRHATLCLSAEDVLTFLGRKRHGKFEGEVLTETKKRSRGCRVKHRMTANWIKMYDKFGVVRRIETVINRPYEFRVRRRGKRQGKVVLAWFPMPKGVAFLPRYQQVCLAANTRYLEALSAVQDPSASYRLLNEITEPATYRTRPCRGLNPLRRDDLALFTACLRGEHAVHGFRNRDLLAHLFPRSPRDPASDPTRAKKHRAKVTRLIQLLRAHGLIAKIPRSRRYRLTPRGLQIMGAAVYLRKEDFPDLVHRIPA